MSNNTRKEIKAAVISVSIVLALVLAGFALIKAGVWKKNACGQYWSVCVTVIYE